MSAVRIRPITREDTQRVVVWRNTDAVRENVFDPRPITAQDHHAWLLTQVDTGKCCQFIIEVRGGDGWQPIGSSFLKNIDRRAKTAEFGIFIGEAAARGKGFGTAATQKTAQYGFDALGLAEIYLYVFAENMPARKAYEKIGFAPVQGDAAPHPRPVVKMALRAPQKQ